ncbi:hypothetical protein CWC18_00180, partial [Pseudoalteromonas aurantia]
PPGPPPPPPIYYFMQSTAYERYRFYSISDGSASDLNVAATQKVKKKANVVKVSAVVHTKH